MGRIRLLMALQVLARPVPIAVVLDPVPQNFDASSDASGRVIHRIPFSWRDPSGVQFFNFYSANLCFGYLGDRVYR